MSKLQELEQELEQAIDGRDAKWNGGNISREWIAARNKVEDLTTAINKLNLKDASKPAMPQWQVAQLDAVWDED